MRKAQIPKRRTEVSLRASFMSLKILLISNFDSLIFLVSSKVVKKRIPMIRDSKNMSKKIHRQPIVTAKKPAINGPVATPRAEALPKNPMASPLRSKGAVSPIIAMIAGKMNALPKPCKIRAPRKIVMFGERAHIKEPIA